MGYGRVLKHSPRNVALGPAPELERPLAMDEPLALRPTTEQNPEHQNPTLLGHRRGTISDRLGSNRAARLLDDSAHIHGVP